MVSFLPGLMKLNTILLPERAAYSVSKFLKSSRVSAICGGKLSEIYAVTVTGCLRSLSNDNVVALNVYLLSLVRSRRKNHEYEIMFTTITIAVINKTPVVKLCLFFILLFR